MPDVLVTPLQVIATILIAYIIIALWRRARQHMAERDWLPPTASLLAGRLVNWMVVAGAAVVILESAGLPVKSMWTGLLSILVMVAIAFFASWSILSNILSSVLLLTFSRLRVGDTVELRESKRDEFGVAGRVVDINAFFVTLQEIEDGNLPGHKLAQVQIPNHLFFYRVMRRWPGDATQPLIEAYKQHNKTDEQN